MLSRRPFGVGQISFVFPSDEILGGRGPNRTHSFAEVAPIGAILATVGVPEGEVLRVERAVGNDRLILNQFPMLAIGRPERCLLNSV